MRPLSPLSLALLVLLVLAAFLPGGPLVHPSAVDAPVVILYSSADGPRVQTHCPPGTPCARIALEGFDCARRRDAHTPHTVVLAGHSMPPLHYLGHSADEVAGIVACLEPTVVVLDTCYGASLPILDAMASVGLRSMVLGATVRLPPQGLRYEDALFAWERPEPAEHLISMRSGEELEVFRLDPGILEAAEVQVDRWGVDTLLDRLQRKRPNLVRVELAGSEAEILVPVDAARFGRTGSS